MAIWLIWLILAALLIVVELFTGAIAAICLAIGCLGGMIPAMFNASIVLQIVVFAVFATLAFIFIRPVLKNVLKPRNTQEYRTNMDALIGRYGKVTKEVTSNFDDKGRVQIDGDSWLAYTTSSQCPIPRGSQVIVESYESLVIKVRPAD